MNLSGVFFWPIFARSHAANEDERTVLSHRFTHEILRLSMYGSMNAPRFPEVAERLAAEAKQKD
jgi:hypothetical protein